MGYELTSSQTLCWVCGNAVPSPETGAGCPWSISGTPVEGWTAERRDLRRQRGKGLERRTEVTESYRVYACPLYMGETAQTTKGATMRTTHWDTLRARDLKNEGRSNAEIADAVGTTESAVKAYFARVAADNRKLQEKLDEVRGSASEAEQVQPKYATHSHKQTREERAKAFRERTDTRWAINHETAKKVATLLAESAATVPEVDRIMELAKHCLVVTVNHTDGQDHP